MKQAEARGGELWALKQDSAAHASAHDVILLKATIHELKAELAEVKREEMRQIEPEPTQAEWVLGETEFTDTSSISFQEVQNGQPCFRTFDPEIKGPIAPGIATLRKDPETYEALFFRDECLNWTPNQQSYTLVKRMAGCEILVSPTPGGGFRWVQAVDRGRVKLWSGMVVGEGIFVFHLLDSDSDWKKPSVVVMSACQYEV